MWPIYIFLAVLLLIVIVFGWSSGMQSYATAQQAQAQIEVAQVAQINAWGNVLTILIVGLIVVVMLAIFAFIAWLFLRRALAGNASAARETSRSQAPMLGKEEMGMLMQMKMLQMLDSMAPNRQAHLAAPRDEETAEEPLSWLRLE